MMRAWILPLLAMGFLAPSASAQSGRPPAFAFEGVTVVPMDSPRVLPDQTVLVTGDRIAWIGARSRASLPPRTQRIAGQGRFLLPGLVDVHVHITPKDFPLFLANGVTTVREMNGSPDHLVWRDEVRRGVRLGPTLYVASPLLAGVRQRWRHTLVTSDTAAIRVVKEHGAAAYDLIKVYDGLSLEVYRAVVAEAARIGLPVAGHIPEDVGLSRALTHRQAEIEHVEQIARAISSHDPNTARIEPTAKEIAGSGTWVVPTLAVIEGLTLMRTAEVQSRFAAPEMAFVDSATFGWWSALRRSSPEPVPTPMAARIVAFYRGLVGALARHGVRMAAGSDTPNPMMVPGFSLLEEIRALEGVGLSRFAALRAATLDAAELLGGLQEFGTVAVGKRADFVLVEANPLDRLDALQSPAGVMVRGRWLPRDTLQAMLQSARRR